MKIIKSTPNPSGAYPPILTWNGDAPPPGWLKLAETCDTAPALACCGFLRLTVSGDTVTAMEGDSAAWEAWKASCPDPAEPEPTAAERISTLEAENKLLTAQVAAQSDQLDFYEDCIAEMASIVYA